MTFLDTKPILKTKEVKVNDEVYILRQPTVGDTIKIQDKLKGDNSIALLIWSIILCCVDDKGNKVFTDEDYDKFLEFPPSFLQDNFLLPVTELMGESKDTKKT